MIIGLDLGDRGNFYCVMSGARKVILAAKIATNPEAMERIQFHHMDNVT